MKTIHIAFLLASMTSVISGQTLSDQLKASEAASAKKLTPEIQVAFKKGIEAVREAEIVEGAKKVGDQAPDFTLKDAMGKSVTLSTELKKGPVVLTWYRGGWCPYCNIALAAMQGELPAMKKAGATLIALTPELPDKVLSTQEKHALKFPVLTDLNHHVAKEYGLLFQLTPEVEKIYGQFFDLAEFNGADAGTATLPLAATYIIGTDRKILWAFLHHDYHKRAEPKEIVKFLNSMKK